MPPKSEKNEKKKEYKPKIFKGTVYILKDRCKGCGFCIEYCSKKILKTSVEFNEKGYHFPIVTDEKGCVNCKVCEDICPDFAIFSITQEEDDQGKKSDKDKKSGGAH